MKSMLPLEMTAEMSKSMTAVPSPTLNDRVPPRSRLPLTVEVAVDAALAVRVPPSVSVPAPVDTLPPLSDSAPTVSELLFRLSRPDELIVTVAESAICEPAPSCTMSASGPPVPSPIVRLPAMAFTPADLLKSNVPALTVVAPV